MVKLQTQIEQRVLGADVLVIGAGGAGLRAAIEAHNAGAEVLVVAKGNFPSGCTTVAMGGISAAFDEQDTPQLHFEDTIHGGHRLNNPRFVKLLVSHASERIKDLEQYGTVFEKQGKNFKLFPYTGSSIPRAVVAFERYQGGFIKGLVKEVKRLAINVIEQVMITDLIKEEAAVVGAIGLELETDTILLIKAKAVILATGGAGNLYSLTTNPPGLTGDGYVLAYKAGARLQDMEFVQTRACLIYPSGLRGMPPPADGLVTLGGRFYNGLCERYMRKYYREKLELVTRDAMAVCAQREIQAGRGSPHGGVFGDLSGVPREELDKFEGFMKACAAENFDPTWQPYEWAPGAHFFMGGVAINDRCETGIVGLFAAGEVSSGTHGANRLTGNALTETQVFGAIAGEYAAKLALSISNNPISSSQIDIARSRIVEILERDNGFDPAEVQDEVIKIMSRYVGDIRNEDGLRKASRMLNEIKKNKILNLRPRGDRTFKTFANLLEVGNLLTVSYLVTLAARLRTETRGAHNREDYPKLDEGWLKNIFLQLYKGKTIARMKPVNR